MKILLSFVSIGMICDAVALSQNKFYEGGYNDPVFQKKFHNLYAAIPNENPEEVKLKAPDIIKKYGYTCETHYVTTSDGYILTLHRIPNGNKTRQAAKKTPFFLQHGLLSSSVDWLVTGTEKALSFILANAGYDVWIGNFRGNKYSRNHTNLHPDEDADKFWNFSWHEMGIYDLPTMIDYVLEKTQKAKLFYVGHSQGTTAFFVMCSEKPEYNDKIRVQFSLAPIAYMNHITSPMLKVVSIADLGIETFFKVIGINEFLPNTEWIGKIGSELCNEGATQAICTNSLFLLCGFSPDQMNASVLPIITSHTPAGSSSKQLIHYAQEIKSGYFRQWDYQPFENLHHYQSLYPPEYDLEKITAPIYLIYSLNDWMSSEIDVNRLYKKLANCRGKFVVADKNFNHLDFLYGIDAPELVYSKVIGLASKYH